MTAQDSSYAVDLPIDIPFDLPRDAEVVGVSRLEVSLLRNAHVDDLIEKLSCIHTPVLLFLRFVQTESLRYSLVPITVSRLFGVVLLMFLVLLLQDHLLALSLQALDLLLHLTFRLRPGRDLLLLDPLLHTPQVALPCQQSNPFQLMERMPGCGDCHSNVSRQSPD